MNSQSAPPSVCVSDDDCFSWVSGQPVEDVLLRAVSVAEDVLWLGDMDVHCLGDGSRVRISLAADDEWLPGKNASSTHVDCSRAVNEGLRLAVTGQFLQRHRSQPIAEDPELSKGQCDRDGQQNELVARLLAPLCSKGGRRFRQLMRFDKQSPDTTSGVHAGKGDFDLGVKSSCSGTRERETGQTRVGCLMIGLDAGGETAILHELKLGEVVTTFRTSGFGVETGVQEFEPHCVGRRRP